MEGFDGALSELEEGLEGEAKRKEEEARKTNMGDHVTQWLKKIDLSRKHDEYFHNRWKADRKMARGDTDDQVNSNLIGAIMEVILAFLYAKDPDLNVRPSSSVGKTRLKDFREFADTIETIVSRLLRDAGLKRQAKRWVRGAETVGLGWLKVHMQTRTDKDPIMQNQINDLQDQLDKIASKNIQLDLNEGQLSVIQSEIEQNIRAAEDKLELVLAEGVVIDYMHPEHVFLAQECGEAENYVASPWIAFATFKTLDETLAITGWKTREEYDCLLGANLFHQRKRGEADGEDQISYIKATERSQDCTLAEVSEGGFYCVYEIWSLTDATVYTVIDGLKSKWARKPYTPISGKRFYPCFQLGFHYVDGERYPQSDVYQLTKLQKEYNAIRSNFARHRERAVPGIVFDATQVDPEDVKKLLRGTTQEYIGIELTQAGADIRTVFAPKVYNPVDMGLYDTSVITREMEKLSGAQDALQSSVQIEKTATEARIQESGFGARTDARRDQLEDVLTDLCSYVAQLALQLMDEADAEKYAGPEAMWIPLSTEQALTMFDMEVKAGSTGKPKALSDREAWPTLMPLIESTIARVGEARQMGKEWAAKPWIHLLEETLNRLDDHADIEKFLPEVPAEEVTPPQPPQPEPKPESEIELDKAQALKAKADAVDKIPSLMFSPETRELLGMENEQDATTEQLMAALQGGAGSQIPQSQPQ